MLITRQNKAISLPTGACSIALWPRWVSMNMTVCSNTRHTPLEHFIRNFVAMLGRLKWSDQSHDILDEWQHTLDSSCIVPIAALFGSLWVQIFILPTAVDSDWSVWHSHNSTLQQWVGWVVIPWTPPNLKILCKTIYTDSLAYNVMHVLPPLIIHHYTEHALSVPVSSELNNWSLTSLKHWRMAVFWECT